MCVGLGDRTGSFQLLLLSGLLQVTRENRLRFVHLMADYRLNKQTRQQTQAFIRGLSSIIDLEWLRMFRADEVCFPCVVSVRCVEMCSECIYSLRLRVVVCISGCYCCVYVPCGCPFVSVFCHQLGVFVCHFSTGCACLRLHIRQHIVTAVWRLGLGPRAIGLSSACLCRCVWQAERVVYLSHALFFASPLFLADSRCALTSSAPVMLGL